ncbi:MAG: hypothetical protein KF760_18540 [Candidatus Eremiobacteraeota bacterium]|nr:hypothetical protein [Candidatus Eremiobacteraeota bacterium]MCW5867348.1 hypothetical protein [Candidatus Eremiobacteraeota bacterium]
MIIPLRDAPSEAGGKAYQLGRLLRAGEKIPEGFCLLDDSLESAVDAWRRLLGGRPVAVRSSAAREDGAVESFAGQFCTVLGVAGEQALREALAAVRASIGVGSVLVQPMLPARVAGVYFTADPTVGEECARVEATPGLGEQLVSGRVRPGAWRLDAAGLTLLDGSACLGEEEILRLQAAAERARTLLGGELDLEFAFTDEPEPWILQARPITARALGSQELCRQQQELLRSLAEPGGTVWSRYSLAETLPHPTPMTWAIVDRMLSLRGAYGKLYRDLGYDPDPALGPAGVADLICGRPYINLSREPRLYFKDFPLAYPLAKLKADPRLASYPTPEVDLKAARAGFWRRLPATLWKMFRVQSRLGKLRRDFSQDLRQRIAPSFLRRMEQKAAEDLGGFSGEQLRERLEELLRLVVDDFAGDTLKASAFAHMLKGGPASFRLDPEADLAGLMREAASGRLPFAELLERIGHRGNGEMELANPRWREVPQQLRAELSRLGPAAAPVRTDEHPDHEWLRLRELGRHWLMAGWAEIRRTLLALDRALHLQGNIFWLTPAELAAPDLDLAARRRRQHRLLQSIACPAVLFSDDPEAIGRPLPEQAAAGEQKQGTPLSWGIAEGRALVVERPEQVGDGECGYILVCPTTDPAYTAAMSRARALVVETGGVLSHGAIVARELGLPALANIPIGLIRSGQRLRVDGQQGLLTWLADEEGPAEGGKGRDEA